MAQPLNAKKFCAEILAGQHDEDLDDIFQAVLENARKEKSRVRWRITWPAHDLVITEDDLTLDECARIEQMTGVRWHAIDPIDSAKEASAILVVALSARRDLPLDDATKQVGALGARAVMDMIDKYIAEASPLDQETVASPPLP